MSITDTATVARPVPPPRWLNALLRDRQAVPPRSTTDFGDPLSRLAAGDSIADWFSDTARWADILGPAGWTLISGDGDSDGSAWRHPTATSPASATTRHGMLFVYSPNTPLDITEPGRPHGYTRFRAWAVLAHFGDLSTAARAARGLRDGRAA
jgi:hypothetical protein